MIVSIQVEFLFVGDCCRFPIVILLYPFFCHVNPTLLMFCGQLYGFLYIFALETFVSELSSHSSVRYVVDFQLFHEFTTSYSFTIGIGSSDLSLYRECLMFIELRLWPRFSFRLVIIILDHVFDQLIPKFLPVSLKLLVCEYDSRIFSLMSFVNIILIYFTYEVDGFDVVVSNVI